MREKFAAGFGAVYPLVVALRQESGQLGFDLPALVFREETTRQLGAQFVDMILKAAVGAEFSFRLRAASIPGCVSLVSDAEERARDGL